MQRLALLCSGLTLAAYLAPVAQAQWSTQALAVARRGPLAVTVDDKALFAGGQALGTYLDAVDIYDDASGTWSTATLSVARRDLAATAVGHLALFAGGADDKTTSTDVVDVFDAQSMTWSTATLSQARHGLSATTVGNKAIFAGGATGGPNFPTAASDVVDIYDSAIGPPTDPNAWSTDTLSVARAYMAAASVGSQALFAGGIGASITPLDEVDIYDDATGLWSTATLSQARVLNENASATVGGRAYFGGGQTTLGQFMSNVVDVYDSQTGLWSTDNLSLARGYVAVTAVGYLVFFAGGYTDGMASSNPSNVIEVLNANTGSWEPTAQLTGARWDLAATTLGSKAMFAGGTGGFGFPSLVVDVYEELGTSFCTAKTTSVCGAALLSGSGLASVSAGSGFIASAAPTRGCRAGLLLYSNQPNMTAVTFGGPGDGFLCLSTQGLKRAGPIDSGGSSPASCDGALAIDMNAFAQGAWVAPGCSPAPGQNNPAAFLNSMGTVVNAQMWGRDSVSTGQVLSNGLTYTVGP